MQDIVKKIYDYSLEEIMGKCFGRYAKTIIQDRALPDVRDGLKPVQRRILYSMYREKNTYDKPYRKAARSVGDVMGKYHPHGDSSIYEAIVRMSQWWKLNTTLIDMHGNNGSMDGDSPAAMRYTEARLSKISNELLKDIDKDTIIWAPNFDDTLWEPTVLPARFPNLLVNGSTGISAGYATNIPPHNLGEIIDATIKRIESPNCSLDDILEIVKGPDFPTSAIVEGISGIREAYETGRGRVFVKAKTEFAKNKGKDQIIITELPFEVNKANLVKKIDEIRLDKKIEGIAEVRDESDREGLRIAIDLKKDANKELILNYLLKNTELKISYNFNMVAIVNRRPMTLGIIPIIDAYIDHQKEVVTKKTEFDLNFAKNRMHIVEGLIKALDILDEIIKTIRASKNKADAKDNLIKLYEFSERQAEAIVTLQLYRLSNTDINDLLKEFSNLEKVIKLLESILSSEVKLKNVIKDDLKKIKDEYGSDRKTVIEDEVTEIRIDTKEMVTKEDCIVVVTNEGYIKRVPIRSYTTSSDDTLVKDKDFVTGIYEMNTMDTLLLFTNMGNYLYIPVFEIHELKWKDLGKHVSNVVKLNMDESIIGSVPVYEFNDDYITIFTKNGMVKRTLVSDFKVQRYSKAMMAIKLKDDDEVVSVCGGRKSHVFIVTRNGYALHYRVDEIPIVGLKTSGVKAINLKDDIVLNAHVFDSGEFITIVTDKGTGKRIRLGEFELSSRARRGLLLVREVKTNPYRILNSFVLNGKDSINVMIDDDVLNLKLTELPIADRYSVGMQITKKKILNVYEVKGLVKRDDVPIKELEEDISLDEVDQRIMTIDDFLKDLDK